MARTVELAGIGLSKRQRTGALEQIRAWLPTLVIVDLRLERPESGWELIQLLGKTPQTKRVPILRCSGDRDFLHLHAQELTALRCGVLEKPFDIDTLLQSIRRQIDTEREHTRGVRERDV